MIPIPVRFKGQLVSDDVFDQLVEDVLAEMDSEEEEEQVETTPAKASSKDEDTPDEDSGDDGETLALDDDVESDDEDASQSNFEITSDAPPKATESKPEAKPESKTEAKSRPAKPKAEKSPAGDSTASKAKPSPEGDSAIDDKSSGRAALPLCTTAEFVHPSYTVTHTLSVISSRRVVSLGDVAPAEGRSSEGETLIGTVERELKVELRAIAAKRGAHAVVGVEIAFTTPGNGLLIATASGTPVRLSKRSDAK